MDNFDDQYKKMVKHVGLLVLVFLVLVFLVWNVGRRYGSSNESSGSSHGSRFFDTKTTYPELLEINVKEVLHELNLQNQVWIPWPEPLANKKQNWNTLPLYGFGHFSKQSKFFPDLTRRLKQLPNLKLATFSRLSPGTRLTAHCGWASHSNHVLRSHLLLSLPRRRGTCALHVENEQHVYDHVGEWITFDDSLSHWARNDDDTDDRIVLIIDMARPPHVPVGTSTSPDSSELQEFVQNNAE